MWMRPKRKLKRQFGTSEELLGLYLDEVTFRNTGNQEVSVFARLHAALQKNYPLMCFHPFTCSWYLISDLHPPTFCCPCSYSLSPTMGVYSNSSVWEEIHQIWWCIIWYQGGYKGYFSISFSKLALKIAFLGVGWGSSEDHHKTISKLNKFITKLQEAVEVKRILSLCFLSFMLPPEIILYVLGRV